MNVREIDFECVKSMKLARVRDQWLLFVNTIANR
jgi:hypothetical protein